jgi:hypothetical protein
MTPFRLVLPGFLLIAALATACSFDASKLRQPAARADGAADHPASPYLDAPNSNDDTADVSDAPTAISDSLPGAGGSSASTATGGAGGSDAPAEIATTQIDDGAWGTGGAMNSDVAIATGGTGAGGSGGIGEDATVGSGGSSSGGASGGDTVMGGGGANTGGNTGTGGQTNMGGADGGGTSGARDAASSGGGSGGQVGSGGQTSSGGSAGGSGSSSDAGSGGGRTCVVGQCPPTATIGITGPWGATLSNGSTGTVVTSGDAVFLNWLATRGTNCVVQNLDISGSNYLTAARLAPYQIIIVLDTYHTQADKNAFFNTKLTNAGYPAYPGTQRTLLASEVTAVRDWVNGGGGLMTTIGTASVAAEMTNTNLLLNPFGIAYSVTDVNVLLGLSTITTFSTAAPIASQLTAGITTMRVTGAVVIEGLAGGNLPPNSSTFSMYASSSYSSRAGSGTYELGVAKIVNGAGRINLWGDETITYDSAWNTSTLQTQTYWSNALTWLGQCP